MAASIIDDGTTTEDCRTCARGGDDLPIFSCCMKGRTKGIRVQYTILLLSCIVITATYSVLNRSCSSGGVRAHVGTIYV